MVKTKELIICIISIIALVLTMATTVFATDDIQDLNSLMGNTTIDTNTNTDFEEIEETTNNVVNTNTNVNVNTNTNTNVNTNVNNNVNATNTIPNTGVSYSSLVIIAIAGISAIYAYKKIKEYNV